MSDKGCLYKLLGLEPSCSAKDIKKAYRTLALKLHPDRNPSPDATQQFQAVQRVYGILSDPKKRRLYDETGETSDDFYGDDGDNDLQELINILLQQDQAPIEENDIESFFDKYEGSEEEKHDLLGLYKKFGGSMKKVLEWQISRERDEDRFRFKEIIESAISDGNARSSSSFEEWVKKLGDIPRESSSTKSTKRRKKTTSKRKQKSNENEMSLSLIAQIRGKKRSNKARVDGLLSSLAEKYGDEFYDEPDEDAFQKARERMESNRKKSKSSRKFSRNTSLDQTGPLGPKLL